MTREIFTATLLSFTLMTPACGGGDKPAEKTDKGGADAKAQPLDPRVAKAVELADAIAKSPDDADAILEKHGLDRDKLDAMMYEIAKDPALASAYRVARSD